jgi:PAS domain S-box-containing protein
MPGISTHFLEGTGKLRSLIRSYDWSASPLQGPDTWPQSFKTLVGFALDSKFPMFLAWGEELACIYNDAYLEILGIKHPQALGRPFKDVWPELWNELSPLVERALSGEAVYLENLPLAMYRKGYEETAWFTFTYSPIRDDAGTVQGMCCTCVETTQHVLAERQRAVEIERLQSLFQQTPGFMALMSGPEHVYELTNPTYLQLLGHRDVIGQGVREALPELEGQGYFEILDRVFESGEPFIGEALPVKLQRQPNSPLDERLLDFIFQPVKNHEGKVSAIFIQGSDVTEAVKAQQALIESEQRLRQLANTIPHLAWMANPDGSIHWYNDRWYEFTGLSEEKIGQWKWEDVIDPPYLQSIMERWGTSVATGVPYEFTGPVRSVSGEYRTFYMTASPLRDANGNIVQWFGINTDVTEIHKAQEELLAASRRKDDFLAMLAHELRNPLAPINSAAELLKLASQNNSTLEKTSSIIMRQVAHMRELLDDLLDVSRVTRGLITLQEKVVDLKTIVAEAVEQVHGLIETKKQVLTVQDASDQTMHVKGDRTRLTQVLTNILNNAAKYTPESGAITIRLSADHGQAEVTVSDTGMGISPELLPHVFELFTQGERSADRSQGGLGLGLALVKSLVELHGGTVAATSPGIGKGSEFCIKLPKLEDRSNSLDKQGENLNAFSSSTSSRILVVDDNVDAAETLAMLLEALGHTVSIEHSARKALESARREIPKMVFLDIGLPEMNGYELAHRLRTIPEMAAATLIAVTGYGQPEDRARALAAGFDHHLVKPVSLDSILERIG